MKSFAKKYGTFYKHRADRYASDLRIGRRSRDGEQRRDGITKEYVPHDHHHRGEDIPEKSSNGRVQHVRMYGGYFSADRIFQFRQT
ncbi:hypothetical protein TNCV_2682811 [Trichonephila clavipes]|nr:hypothetical protein TNCV_2682811 [Trichonephila clavipes]